VAARLSALFSLALLLPAMLCTLLCRPVLQPTIRSDLSGAILTDYRCALLCLAILDYYQLSSALCRHSTLPVDITPDYLLYQLSALISLALLQLRICCDLLGLPILQPTFLCASFIPLCLPTLQLTIRSAPRQRRYRFGARQSDNPFGSVFRYYNRLSTVLLCSLSNG
jgi:hypothetical protein